RVGRLPPVAAAALGPPRPRAAHGPSGLLLARRSSRARPRARYPPARRGDRTMSDACCGGSPDTSCGPAPAAVRPEPAARPTASPLLVVVVSALLIVAGALTARLGYTVPSVLLYLGAIGLS